MKITVVGGGSTYAPELAEGLINYCQELGLKELCLFDINPKRLRIVGELVQRMVQKVGSPFQVVLTTNQVDAVSGADFVLNQMRVGGQQARHDDTMFCMAEGIIGQETTGPAGFAKALRTIPVVLDLCKDITKHAPRARLINFTNPSGIVTEAVLKYTDVPTIGLCNVPMGMKMAVAKKYDVTHSDVDLDYVGLNHLSWVRKIWVRGCDVTQDILQEESDRPANIPKFELSKEFRTALNMKLNGYLSYFYLTDEILERNMKKEKTRAQEVMEIEAELLKKYGDPKLEEKPAELERRGGAYYSTASVLLILDMVRNSGAKHVVNVQNNGVLPELPTDCVVEVTASVDARGAHPFMIGKLEPEIRGLIQQVKAYEELTVEAAVHGDYHKALLALVNNPLVSSSHKAQRLLDKFIEHHKLPIKKR